MSLGTPQKIRAPKVSADTKEVLRKIRAALAALPAEGDGNVTYVNTRELEPASLRSAISFLLGEDEKGLFVTEMRSLPATQQLNKLVKALEGRYPEGDKKIPVYMFNVLYSNTFKSDDVFETTEKFRDAAADIRRACADAHITLDYLLDQKVPLNRWR